jgi:ABC-type Fe3+-hydroxamate transport system substrate-binding protein
MRRLFPLAFVLTLLLFACGDSGSPTTSSIGTTTTASESTTTETPPPTTTTTTTTTEATTTSASSDLPLIKVEDGVKTDGLDTISVRVGETVRFEVEADVADEVHIHGYDLSFETIPGEEILIEFVADATGIFEVEIEGLALHIVDIEVTP